MNFFDTIYTREPIPEPGEYTKKRGWQRPPLLTPSAINAIREKFLTGRISMKSLARKYDCHYRTISKIVHHRSPYADKH